MTLCVLLPDAHDAVNGVYRLPAALLEAPGARRVLAAAYCSKVGEGDLAPEVDDHGRALDEALPHCVAYWRVYELCQRWKSYRQRGKAAATASARPAGASALSVAARPASGEAKIGGSEVEKGRGDARRRREWRPLRPCPCALTPACGGAAPDCACRLLATYSAVNAAYKYRKACAFCHLAVDWAASFPTFQSFYETWESSVNGRDERAGLARVRSEAAAWLDKPFFQAWRRTAAAAEAAEAAAAAHDGVHERDSHSAAVVGSASTGAAARRVIVLDDSSDDEDDGESKTPPPKRTRGGGATPQLAARDAVMVRSTPESSARLDDAPAAGAETKSATDGASPVDVEAVVRALEAHSASSTSVTADSAPIAIATAAALLLRALRVGALRVQSPLAFLADRTR